MPQYKVPQNVEAEDKILGPLSLRQFIYVIIALMWAFIMWRVFISVPLIAIIAALPVSGVFLALGLIQREEQSFENYFVAMLRFVIVPRKRMWHKDEMRSALKDPTSQTRPTVAPPQRNPAEVRGQLEKLALVVDTRGRVPKPATIQLPDTTNQASTLSARVNRPSVSQPTHEVAGAKITAGDDILDMQTSDQAAILDKLLKKAETQAHNQVIATMHTAASAPTPKPAPAPTPTSTTTSASAPIAPPVQQQNQKQNDILDLAMSGSSLSVAQIASQANRASQTAGQLIENQPASLR